MSKTTLIVLGSLAGILVLSGGLFGFSRSEGLVLAGALVGSGFGYLIFELRRLTSRINTLEQRVRSEQPLPADDLDSTDKKPVTATKERSAIERLDDKPVGTQPDMTSKAAAAPAYDARREAVGWSRDTRTPDTAKAIQSTAYSSLIDDWTEKVKEWFTTGNVPVKVGVIVSFFGFAFLLKYAVDRNMLILPMGLRLVSAALFGSLLVGLGWRLRHRMRVYALSLQGGGIGIIYLAIFAAFRLYQLLPPVPAFVMLVALTIPVAALAVLQDARGMALLALAGGFLAPVLTSTGQGSHVALFSYYLLLNIAIVAIAWYKSWRELNLAGFLFTFVIGTTWGYKYYRPQFFSSTEPFLVLHFLLYQVTAILFAFRQPPRLRGIVDGMLVFGTPIIAFALQAKLLQDTEHGLAWSAVVVAAFYAFTAWWLRKHEEQIVLRQSFIALGVAFATIAIPLAFDAGWTSAAWAMEGSALVWLGVRQQGSLAKLSGSALIVLAGISFFIQGWHPDAGVMIVNRNVLGGLLLSLAGFFTARQFLAAATHSQHKISILLLLWGITWWLGTGLAEVDDRSRYALEYPLMVTFIVISSVLLGWIARRLSWRDAEWATFIMLPLLAIAVLLRSPDHPFEYYALLPWCLAAAAHYYLLRPMPTGLVPVEIWHVGGVLFAAWLMIWELDWWVVVDTWRNTLISLVLIALAAGCWLARPLIKWPLQVESQAYTVGSGILIGISLVFITAFNIASAGHPLPLPYIPLLNPYDIVTLVFLTVAFMTVRQVQSEFTLEKTLERNLTRGIGLVAFILGTIAIVRGVHHIGDVPWQAHVLKQSVEVQTSLSIFWGLLGFIGMLVGANQNRRGVWLTGSALMGLVVAKLFLVDLGNSGTVARIVSFIGVGALLLVVGYFAPAPPRHSATDIDEG